MMENKQKPIIIITSRDKFFEKENYINQILIY